MSIQVNGVEVSSGEGKACLGSTLIAVQWLATHMAEVGTPLKSGEVIFPELWNADELENWGVTNLEGYKKL